MSEKTIDIDRIAALSKLAFSEEEKLSLERDMKAILELADMLPAADDAGSFSIDTETKSIALSSLRSDSVKESLDRELILSQAPITSGDFIAVPCIVEE